MFGAALSRCPQSAGDASFYYSALRLAGERKKNLELFPFAIEKLTGRDNENIESIQVHKQFTVCLF